MSAHASACQDAYRRKRERRAADVLDPAQVDAITLDALADGCTLEEFAGRLQEARELASEGVPLDARGKVQWAY